MKSKYGVPIVGLFILVSMLCSLGKSFLTDKGVDSSVVLTGNVILFFVTILSQFLLIQGMQAKTTNNFLKSIYISFMAKLFICAISAFVYIKTAKPVNKPAIFVLLALYLVYAFLEIKGINQLTKDLKNGKATGSN